VCQILFYRLTGHSFFFLTFLLSFNSIHSPSVLDHCCQARSLPRPYRVD
jgi:hypothetical protein